MNLSQFFLLTLRRLYFYTPQSNNDLKSFQDFLNSCHVNMPFVMETGKENKLSFCNVAIICANKVNSQPQFIENLLLVAYIVTLKVFYFLFINLVWYIL